jgi:hypothetical protein
MKAVISFVALAIGRAVSASRSARTSPDSSSTSSQLPAGRSSGGFAAAKPDEGAATRKAHAASAATPALSGAA